MEQLGLFQVYAFKIKPGFITCNRGRLAVFYPCVKLSQLNFLLASVQTILSTHLSPFKESEHNSPIYSLNYIKFII